MKIRTSSHGFTLIELLVVIVIIAILAGISLPVFSRIMERGKVIEELSNLRQIGIATLAYINDNDGYVATDFDTKWAEHLGGVTAADPADSVEGRYVQDPSVFLSPFDSGAGRDQPVSFGANRDISTTANTELWKNTSSLVLLVPILTAVEVFDDKNTRSSSEPASAPIEFGSHNNGRRTSVLFADFHVEAVNIVELNDTTPTAKYKWDMN